MALNLVLAISAHEGIEKPLKRLALKQYNCINMK